MFLLLFARQSPTICFSMVFPQIPGITAPKCLRQGVFFAILFLKRAIRRQSYAAEDGGIVWKLIWNRARGRCSRSR